MVDKIDVNNLAFKIFEHLGSNLGFVVLCVGSSKCVGDSLGCAVGSLLKYKYKIPNFCYGDMDKNVDRGNVEKYVEFISRKHCGRKVVVVDSAVGLAVDVGRVKVRYGGIVPRSAIDDSFMVVGDVAITGVVESACVGEAGLLGVKSEKVLDMAELIARAICEYRRLVNYLQNEKVL